LIDLVVVNLYPIKKTVDQGAKWEDAIENIDIGGPSMIRSAAKNHKDVSVLVDPSQYQNFLEEIKKGKFLIGLKQYLGGENDSFSEKKNINFSTNKGFLNLISSNGIKHKSKQINITWADIPVKNPKTIERIVFGPFASYESAKKQSEKLRDKGFETTVAYPKNWEVWIPFQDDLQFHLLFYRVLLIHLYWAY